MSAVGFTIAGCSAVGILITALVGLASTWVGGMSVAIAILAVVLGGSSIMAWKGTSILGKMCIRDSPKTIDNDLPVTDHCPGYGSAAKYIASSMKEIIRDNESFGVEKPTVCIVEIRCV